MTQKEGRGGSGPEWRRAREEKEKHRPPSEGRRIPEVAPESWRESRRVSG